jgi:hypothetical protein
MDKNKKIIRSKPNLVIMPLNVETAEENENKRGSESNNEVFVKPLSSAKNRHEMKSFNFNENNIDKINADKKLKKFH